MTGLVKLAPVSQTTIAGSSGCLSSFLERTGIQKKLSGQLGPGR